MLPRKEVGLGASEIVICMVHSMRSSNWKSSFVQRRPFMNSWMFSSKDSKMEASMLAICGAMTCTLQFNSCAVAGAPGHAQTEQNASQTGSKGGVHESKEFKGTHNVFSTSALDFNSNLWELPPFRR